MAIITNMAVVYNIYAGAVFWYEKGIRFAHACRLTLRCNRPTFYSLSI